MPTLTLRESVLFAARMRPPALMNDAERDQRTDEAIEAMGLTHVRDTLVGDAANKQISGGQRRRLGIACELVTCPSILFLDEPTSGEHIAVLCVTVSRSADLQSGTGLDSANALRIIKCLRALARERGINMIFSIHQPDSALFAVRFLSFLLLLFLLLFSSIACRARACVTCTLTELRTYNSCLTMFTCSQKAGWCTQVRLRIWFPTSSLSVTAARPFTTRAIL